jgi:hypothetical protein
MMKGRPILISVLALGLMLALAAGFSLAQGPGPQGDAGIQAAPVSSGFTYQGRLTDGGGNPVNDTCSLDFTLWDAESGGALVGHQLVTGVEVNDGYLTVLLNSGDEFGVDAFEGEERWLKIGVKCSSDADWNVLSGRQLLSAAPYALSLRPGAVISGTVDGKSALTVVNGSGPGGYFASEHNHGVIVHSAGAGNYGVFVEGAGNDGVHVQGAGDCGVSAFGAGGDGVEVSYAGRDGVSVYSPGRYGVYVYEPSERGIRVDSAETDGVYVLSPGQDGVYVDSPVRNGLKVLSPGQHGVSVDSAGYDGVYVESAARDGVHINTADRYGVWAHTVETSYGFYTPDKIYAGNGYVDIAEHIDAASDVEPGDVVVIDPDHDERVVKSTKPYDTSVAGIISTDPAMLIGKSDTETPLALAGRAPCKVSGENGPIRRGDLLTTSSTPGHAMKATEPKLGTILGKALGELESGTGVIYVLVTLQ